jgi:septum formation protein
LLRGGLIFDFSRRREFSVPAGLKKKAVELRSTESRGRLPPRDSPCFPIRLTAVAIVLASASPRRSELLRSAGILFSVQPADIDEAPLAGEIAQDYAERLAREKALAVSQRRPLDYVLGADTIVVVDGAILGKPRDADDAVRMLRLLAGRSHEVITGVCVVSPGAGESKTASETTRVNMCELSDDEIREYVATGEPMDKAGAYAIQGMASRWIPRIEGDYSNVVGLPLALVYGMLRELGAF